MTDRFEHIHLFSAWSRNKNLVHKLIGNYGLYVFAPIQSQSEASLSRETREHVRGRLGTAPKVRCYYNPRLRWFGHFNVRSPRVRPAAGTDGRDSKRIFYAVRASAERE